ncbi:MAG TPA: hypothetical protein VNT60_01765 [Deinococcales bacterium]|nr:hypothetical protein [Deinococcales bacterium]
MSEAGAARRTARGEFLRRRNSLWLELRQREPGGPDFEALLAELCALTGLERAEVLAGLGLTGDAVARG